jgi:tripartite-type tricarboxylate transporter receptor subunit TctC
MNSPTFGQGDGSVRISRRTALALAILCGTPVRPAGADDWPSRPVRIISPFPAGGTADIFARILADHLSTAFKQPFYVDTRTGAGGQIGSLAAATAPPDGYTLVVSGNASHIIAPSFAAAPLYDGVRDFTHIAYLGGPPVGLLVHPSLPAGTYAEFIKFVKASPAPVDYTSSGVGTHGFLFGELFARREGLRLVHIPYKGGGPAMIDLVAGHVKIATMTYSSSAEQVRTGRLKALAVSAEKPLPNYPDIPTFAELGHPDMVSSTWFALSGPKNLPAEIVDRLNREVARALELPDVGKRLVIDAIQVKPMLPQEVTEFIQEETKIWWSLGRELRDSGIKVE